MNSSFLNLTLRDALLENLPALGYTVMTPVQAQSLPTMLEGHDVIAQSKTGSGKTAAFGLTILNCLNAELLEIQALVLCPTRELAEQVCQALRSFARLIPHVKILSLCGGMPSKPQLHSLKHGAHIIVGTPGRIQKHLDQRSLSLKKLQVLVLDEMDKMLDMGFLNDIKAIIRGCPKQRQTLMFSATIPPEINNIAHDFMKNPQEVRIAEAHSEQEIDQRFFEVKKPADKFPLLKAVLLHYQPSSSLIFCNTKKQTAELVKMLIKEGFSAGALHGDLDQAERDEAIICFTNHSCPIIVATDIAARGIDIKELPAVINFELAFEQDIHTHRIGRTGRAGHKGIAFSFVTPADAPLIHAISGNQNHPLIWVTQKELTKISQKIPFPEMVTLRFQAGRKDKIRPGDILGALTKDAGLPANAIGKITITNNHAYVAIHQTQINAAYQHFQNGKLKGRRINVKRLVV